MLNRWRELTTKLGSLRTAAAVLVVVVGVFLLSGPIVRWVGSGAGSGELPYREAAWFVNPSAASVGVTGGSQIRVAITASIRVDVHWSENVGGIVLSSGVVRVTPGAQAEVTVMLPVVKRPTWAKISVGRLAAPLRVELEP